MQKMNKGIIFLFSVFNFILFAYEVPYDIQLFLINNKFIYFSNIIYFCIRKILFIKAFNTITIIITTL